MTHDYSIVKACKGSGVEAAREFRRLEPVVIEREAFVGMSAILLPGSIIGEYSIVGAGSVVRGAVPPRTVVAGNPARRICSVEELWIKYKDRSDVLFYC
jgi:maltose O-acetyltransferase